MSSSQPTNPQHICENLLIEGQRYCGKTELVRLGRRFS